MKCRISKKAIAKSEFGNPHSREIELGSFLRFEMTVDNNLFSPCLAGRQAAGRGSALEDPSSLQRLEVDGAV